ncbi:MAG: hypothetical protein FD147_1048 [Chloroflexi bacterium]|nr:MAG: hypothetical protein FD147_1048 [Chloroflexota bacterium]MBA4374863.1 transcriptional regulator [Anaerolinea sp.]
MSDLTILTKYLPLLIPIALLQFGLLVAALVDLMKRENTKGLPKWGWILVIVFVNLFGPIIYFIFGRDE